MIVAFLNHKGGVDKTTLALQVAGAWAAQVKRIVLIHTDTQGSALDWSEQRAKEGLTQLFDVLVLTRNTVHLEVPEIAWDVDHVVIDGSSHSAAPMRSAMLAADLALVPAQPSPSTAGRQPRHCGCYKSTALRPQLVARLALNRCVVRWLLAGQIAWALARHDPPALGARPGQRVAFRGRRPHRTARPGNGARQADRTRSRCARRRDRADRAMTNRDPKHAFTSRPRDADTWIQSGGPSPPKNGAKADHFTARLTIDLTPGLRGRIKVAAFRRGITVAEMLRDLLSREFPLNPRGAT